MTQSEYSQSNAQQEESLRDSQSTGFPQLIPVDCSDRLHIPDLIQNSVTSMDEGLGIIDEAGRIQFANPALIRMIGSSEDLRGRLLSEAIPHNERFKLEQNLKRILQGERISLELSMPSMDGQDMHVFMSCGPCPSRSEGRYHYVQFTDITEIRRAEAEKLYLMEQILSNRHINRLGTFAGGISHEFNNILQVIRANAEYCQLALQSGKAPAHKLDEIVESTHRAGRMLKQLLAFSKNQLEERTELRVSELARRVMSLTTLRSENAAKCEFDIQTENDLILADEVQLEQVLTQVLGNAIQSIPVADGRLRVRICDASREMMERLPHPGATDNQYLLLQVDDNGNGIPGENIDRVFDPFFTTRSVGEGTGLGLAMALGIVTSHDGTIWASPSQLGGTCMHILLKRINPAVKPVAESSSENSQRVLLVDDEDVIVRLGKRMLSKAGVDVLATSDPQEAWRLLASDPTSFSMLITDQNMPDCNGLDLAELARCGNPDIRVVLCTGYIPDLDDEKISELGIDAVLAKPFDVHEMARMVMRLLPGKESQGQAESTSFPQSA